MYRVFSRTATLLAVAIGGTATLVGDPTPARAAEAAGAAAPLEYRIQLDVLLPAAKEGSWFQPRPAPMPGLGKRGGPAVVMTIQRALGSDFFTGLSSMRTDDVGRTWTGPVSVGQLGWRDAEGGMRVGVCDFQLGWHAPTGRVLAIGHTARYTSKGFAGFGHRRDTVYSVYDPKTGRWTPWEVFQFPETEDDRYFFNGVHGQWLVEPGGTVLVPFYFVGPKKGFLLTAAVMRCRFDGRRLTYLKHGREMRHPVPRGLYEKSLTRFRGRYYLTMRNDRKGYVATSADGLDFGPIRPWTFDDGKELGSYNTHQKWAAHSDGLFLVYTRRGANNDHIVRHRAPLFVARVDPERLCVLRDTERIAVPERGRALGNFDATAISPTETWITVAGGEAYCARLIWSKPNRRMVAPER